MALSNIFREPRREIVESVVGLSILGPFLYGDYCFADWFAVAVAPSPYAAGLVFGMLVGVIGFCVILASAWALLSFGHGLGEAACDALQVRGIHLRPRNRRQ